MRCITKAALIVLLILNTVTIVWAKNIPLFLNGITRYDIVIPQPATAIEQIAATDLQKFIKLSTGVLMAINNENTITSGNHIYLGQTKLALQLKITKNVRDDGFAIAVKQNNIFISGVQKKGTLYGVHHFLETYFGTDYLSASVVIAPKQMSVSIPQNVSMVSNPGFITRDNFTGMGYNGVWQENHNYSNGYRDWHCINHVFQTWGDDDTEWGSFGHTFFQLVPPNEYFNSHPEYYSLINNNRQKQQLCLSNPNVVKVVVQTLQSFMKGNPNKTYWMVGQEDMGSFCQCDNCQKAYQKYGGKTSGLLIEFVNKIAKAFPDKQIATFAYGGTEAPPQNIKPDANVIVVSAPIAAHRNAPLNSPENAQQSNYIRQWKRLTNNQMIWDYYANFIDILAPFPDIAVYSPNFKWYQSMGIRHVFAQRPVFMAGSEMEELKAYLISKLLWNPQLNQDSIIASFTQKYYGDAGKYIVQYVKAMTANVAATKTILAVQQNANDYFNAFLQPQYYQQYMVILDNAANAVKNNPELLKRVNSVRLATDFFVMKMIKTNNLTFLSAVNPALITQAKERFKNTVNELNVRFTADASQQSIEPYLHTYSGKKTISQTLAACGFAACGIYVQKRIKRKRNKKKSIEAETA